MNVQRTVAVATNALIDELGVVPPSLHIVATEPADVPDDVEAIVLGREFAPLVADLGRFRKLELVQTLNAGVEWLVPHIAPGVTLCNASGVHDGAVAEWVVAAILASRRGFPRWFKAQNARRWDDTGNALIEPERFGTDDLDGASVVIVGHGAIGRAVEARLIPFGCRVQGLRRADQARLPELLATADVLVLLVPLTAETAGMVDVAVLAALPDGALVVNAARGAVIDQAALEAELRSGRLRAALDVTDPEPLPAGHSLWTAPGLIITPHVGGSVKRWKQRAYRLAGDQLRRWAAGEPLLNVRTEY